MPIINTNNVITEVVSRVSDANSCFDPHQANEQFVGVWEDCSAYAIISTICRVDQAGTLYYDFSIDAMSVDRSYPIAISDLAMGMYCASGPRARFFRLRYVNGPNPQTVCRIETTYSPTVPEMGVLPVCAGLNPGSNSHGSRALVFGQLPNGSYSPARLTTDGKLIVDSSTDTIATTRTNVFLTNELNTSDDTSDQPILTYSSAGSFVPQSLSVFVRGSTKGAVSYFGDVSLEVGGNKVYTIPLCGMGSANYIIPFGDVPGFASNSLIRVVCTPADTENSNRWRANLCGFSV